ncbi:hypothetical protein SAMN05518801_102245 [Novosphingobium sp. CF614]|nr:hypothetical protein SAMN05518801_102245 [Novosphingobium sp. CF614]
MFPKGASPEDALRASIDALREIISLYDRLGLMFPAVHAAAALHAACSALADEIGISESESEARG